MPLGASMNHAGSALYECAAAMFIAQAYGLHLSFTTQFTVVILALVTSMGMAGIPAASLVGITVILAAMGLPAEAVGVLLVLDRLLDMARTAVNVLADSVCTVIVARLAALPVMRATDHQAVQPARERRLEPELLETRRQFDAGKLRDVLGVRLVATPLPGEPVDRVVVQIQ